MRAGGVFEEAIAQASYFLSDGVPIARTIRNQDVVDNVWTAGRLSAEVFPGRPGQLTAKPLVLLVNSRTASAAEVLTGALRDNHRCAGVVAELHDVPAPCSWARWASCRAAWQRAPNAGSNG